MTHSLPRTLVASASGREAPGRLVYLTDKHRLILLSDPAKPSISGREWQDRLQNCENFFHSPTVGLERNPSGFRAPLNLASCSPLSDLPVQAHQATAPLAGSAVDGATRWAVADRGKLLILILGTKDFLFKTGRGLAYH